MTSTSLFLLNQLDYIRSQFLFHLIEIWSSWSNCQVSVYECICVILKQASSIKYGTGSQFIVAFLKCNLYRVLTAIAVAIFPFVNVRYHPMPHRMLGNRELRCHTWRPTTRGSSCILWLSVILWLVTCDCSIAMSRLNLPVI